MAGLPNKANVRWPLRRSPHRNSDHTMDMRSIIHQCSSSSCATTRRSTDSSVPAFSTSSTLFVPPFPAMPQPLIFQRASPFSSVPRAPTLAPIRFIIPNSRAMNRFSKGGVAPSILSSSNGQTKLTTVGEPEHEPLPPHSVSHSQERFILKSEQQQLFPTGSDNGFRQLKKVAPKRSRTLKPASRSTKSKARPGLRKGKWTEEESRYAAQLTHYFKEGLLPLERGTMLRLYLSQKLNCEPMRITKKFTGGECIGKQVFRPCSPTSDSCVRTTEAQVELVALEAAFIKRLNENCDGSFIPTDELDVDTAVSSCRPHPAPIKPRMYQDGEEDGDDDNAVGLLLEFFNKVNRNEKEGGKGSSTITSDESRHSDNTSDDDDPIIEKLVQTAAPNSPTITSETDLAINSPTKRMRALSVCGYVDPAAVKRSRIGSFSTVSAA